MTPPKTPIARMMIALHEISAASDHRNKDASESLLRARLAGMDEATFSSTFQTLEEHGAVYHTRPGFVKITEC